MRLELHELLAQRMFFRELLDVLNRSRRIDFRNIFICWIVANYVAAQCVSVRRLVDQGDDVTSLWTLIYHILEHPDALSRRHHCSLYSPDKSHLADGDYTRVFGPTCKYASRRCLRSDLRTLESTSSSIRRLVNKRIAHLDRSGRKPKIPVFNDLDAAIDAMESIYKKYHLALTGQAFSQLTPVPQMDWKWIFYEPWVREPAGDHD